MPRARLTSREHVCLAGNGLKRVALRPLARREESAEAKTFRLLIRRLSAVTMLVMSAVGCGGNSDKVKTYAVRGQVLVDGKPAEHALLVFHPIGGDERVQKLSPRATSDRDGFYVPGTYWSSDGAPLGEFKVTAIWRGPLPANANSEDFSMATYEEQPDKFDGRYEDPAKTPLRLTVSAPGDLPPLELSTK